MKIKITLLFLFISIFSMKQIHAVCNWKNRIVAFTAYDSCKSNNTSKIGAYVALNTNTGCIKYNWQVNGVKMSSSNQFNMVLSKNGTYNICLKLLDSCNKCDTTLCFVKVITCIKTCKWFMRNNYYYSWDSCNGKRYKSSLNGAYSSKGCYKYTWKVNGSVVSNSSTLYYNVPKNGQYVVCLTVNDTCDKCDTTYCKTYNITCFTSSKCNWKSRNPYMYGWDTCKGKGYRNNVNAYISFNSNLNGCFKYNWTVNGKAAGTGNVMHYPIVENGTYNMCVKVYDTCNKCDTTFCMSKTISCFSKCIWKQKISSISYTDSCNGYRYRNSLGGKVLMNQNSTPGCYKYNWTLNGINIGNTVQMLAPIYLNGKYNLCLKITDTCNRCDTSICKSFQYNCKNLGIEDQNSNSLMVYPNPASDQINLNCDNCEGGFSIFNSQGQIIYQGHFESMEMRIDVSKWSSGVYVLKRDDGSTSKILIE